MIADVTRGHHVLSVVGARPQFVKAAPVSRALAKAGLDEVLVHTGQHFDHTMSGRFFEELGLSEPAHDLGIHGGPHGEMTGRMLIALEQVMSEARPDAVLVYGDTNSTLAGALAAAKLKIPIAHVEAGLRSGNRKMAEEVNRLVTDRLSQLLLCPTIEAVRNLAAEGIGDGVHHVGDVMLDAVLQSLDRGGSRDIPAELGLADTHFAVATVHRAETTDDPVRLAAIFEYLREIALEAPLVLPLHPRTAAAVARDGLELDPIRVIEPLSHREMLLLSQAASTIYTDSGGLQKEAYFLRVPCVTLRDETEWPETLRHGWNRLWIQATWGPRSDIDEYGDGHAADRIAELLAELRLEVLE